MKKYTPAIIGSVFTLLLLGGAVTYSLLGNKPDAPAASAARVKDMISPKNSQLNASNAPSISQGQSSSLSVDGNRGQTSSGIGLQSNLGQQSSGSSSAASQFPGPESFGTYDQYKDGQAAMVGDFNIGTGTAVAEGTKVAVTYQGWLTNGTLFDESKKDTKGQLQPFIFEVGAHKVIPGWEQAILGMKVGGKRRFIIPSAFGYGASGQGSIPPNATLVFDVSLIDAQ